MRFSKMKLFASLLAATSVAAAPVIASAAEKDSAELADADASMTPFIDFAKSLTERATESLTAADASGAEQLADFQLVLTDGLALETIGKFMLGDARKTMSRSAAYPIRRRIPRLHNTPVCGTIRRHRRQAPGSHRRGAARRAGRDRAHKIRS